MILLFCSVRLLKNFFFFINDMIFLKKFCIAVGCICVVLQTFQLGIASWSRKQSQLVRFHSKTRTEWSHEMFIPALFHNAETANEWPLVDVANPPIELDRSVGEM